MENTFKDMTQVQATRGKTSILVPVPQLLGIMEVKKSRVPENGLHIDIVPTK